MAEINDLVPIDDNNVDRWPEGMPPSDVNNAGRADEGIMSRWHRDTNGSLTSTGTDTAYQLTTNQSLTAYYDGLEITYQAHVTCGASPTLQLGALGTANIVTGDDIEIPDGYIVSGSKVNVIYNGSKWVIMNVPRASNLAYLDRANGFKASPQSVIISDDSAAAGPSVILKRDRSTPAASDDLGVYIFDGVNGSASNVTWAELQARILDPVAATEDGSLVLRTIAGGAVADRMEVQKGVLVGAPTGGDPGDGSLNVAGQVQSNGIEYQKGWAYTSIITPGAVTSVDLITDLPDGVSEIEIFGDNLTTSGNNQIGKIQIGDTVFQTSGYFTTGGVLSGATQNTIAGTDSFFLSDNGVWDATRNFEFVCRLMLRSPSTHVWNSMSHGHIRGFGQELLGYGNIDLANRIERVRFSTSGGTINSGTLQLRYR